MVTSYRPVFTFQCSYSKAIKVEANYCRQAQQGTDHNLLMLKVSIYKFITEFELWSMRQEVR